MSMWYLTVHRGLANRNEWKERGKSLNPNHDLKIDGFDRVRHS